MMIKTEMETQLSNQESLKIIREMIDKAKTGLKDDGFYYLLWGWVVLLSSLIHFTWLQLAPGPYAALTWAVIPFIGVAGTVYWRLKQKNRPKVKSYFKTLTSFLWMGIVACMFILIGTSMGRIISFTTSYPIIIMLMGLGAFVSGGVLRFYLLILGGIAAWGVAIIAFFVSFEYQLLLLGLSVAFAYLIPGYALRRTT